MKEGVGEVFRELSKNKLVEVRTPAIEGLNLLSSDSEKKAEFTAKYGLDFGLGTITAEELARLKSEKEEAIDQT